MSNLDGPASTYIWFGEKQFLYTETLNKGDSKVCELLREMAPNARIHVKFCMEGSFVGLF